MTTRNQLLHSDQVSSFRYFAKAMSESLDTLEKEINSTSRCSHCCSAEGCLTIEHHIDKLHNELYSMSEPRFGSAEDTRKFHELKTRLHRLYQKMERAEN
ncbi:hypothetical protein ACUUL3_00930 [Thiovibrio sp. JS02]